MTLREFMLINRYTSPQLAEALGCSKQHVSYIKSGGKPGKWLADAVERFTEGQVTAAELRPPKDKGTV